MSNPLCPRMFVVLLQVLLIVAPFPATMLAQSDPLSRDFAGGYGQVEVGGPYAGAEFHRSRPFPSRISLYAPAANSIDMSRDYWKRGDSKPVVAAFRVNGGPIRCLGEEPWQYRLSPHTVRFTHRDGALRWVSTFEFFRRLPGMVWTLTCENISAESMHVELYAHVRMILRTCQTYAWLDSAWTEYDRRDAALAVHFTQPETRRATVILQNVGEPPAEWTSSAADSGSAGTFWPATGASLPGRLLRRGRQGPPVAAFVYRKTLAASDSISMRIAITSVGEGEWGGTVRQVRSLWRKELLAYDAMVRRHSSDVPFTGDRTVDGTSPWARALLTTNAHALEGKIVPMPCPAEYNFYFTHDVLLTDLSASFFDPERVRRDLLNIVSLAENGIIPHARYWRDDGFKTEVCAPDDWDHLWFIEVVSRYLRHTLDVPTASKLLPYVTKSLGEILHQCRTDSLMEASRPDWWDIGRKEGPRSYITILTIRALRDYLFLASFLGSPSPDLTRYELLADGMQRALLGRLWDEAVGYLMNFNGADRDPHFYIGSLMGAVYGVLPPGPAGRMLETAGRLLVDPRLGVRNVMPPDFSTDSVRAYFKFQGNEAGDPYFYANGGVWPHGNAWYAQALQATGDAGGALRFFRNTMTLDGICASPMGQPAFYEYRFADSLSPEYGKIDKPSFLWAGGMYLGTLYALMGFEETEWNVCTGHTALGFDSSRCGLEFGGRKTVRVEGASADLGSFTAEGRVVPSCVFPLALSALRRWVITRGGPLHPYLSSVNAIVHSCRATSPATLEIDVSSFDGHCGRAEVVAPAEPVSASLDGRRLVTMESRKRPDGAVVTVLEFRGTGAKQHLAIVY